MKIENDSQLPCHVNERVPNQDLGRKNDTIEYDDLYDDIILKNSGSSVLFLALNVHNFILFYRKIVTATCQT